MLIPVLLVVASLVVLYFGADFLVKGSSSLAVRLGISPLVVGLTVVAFGTSAPELLVSVQSALEGNSGIAVGNVMGSNIFNVCAILGISAMIYPLRVNPRLIRLDAPVMLVATLLFVGIFHNGSFGRWAGILFFSGICVYMIYCVYKAKRGEVVEGDEEIKPTKNWMLDVVLVIARRQCRDYRESLGMERGGNRFDDRGCRDKYAGTGDFRGGCLEKTYGYCHR